MSAAWGGSGLFRDGPDNARGGSIGLYRARGQAMGVAERGPGDGVSRLARCLFIALPFAFGIAQAEVPRLTLDADEASASERQVAPAYFTEGGERLTAAQAQERVAQGGLRHPSGPVISRGMGSEPLWLVVDVLNPGPDPVTRRLSIEIGWLESVEFHHLAGDRILARAREGDALPVAERTSGAHWPRFDARFPSGESRLLIRVATDDPLLVPLYMESLARAASDARTTWLIYGFVYGAVFALMAFNFVLFLCLGHRRHLFYTLYLLGFLAMNLSYTGIGMLFLWPGAAAWQQWAPVLFMVAFGVTGLAFGAHFLGVARHQPRFFRVVVGLGVVFGLAVPLAMALERQSLASLLAFSFIPLFGLSMLYMGVTALSRQPRTALLFVLATTASVLGALVSSLTVWGWLPHTRLGFHAVELGMVIDAILLALALAEQVRLNQQARESAEAAARIDPLTGLANRRGFADVGLPLWALARRNGRPLSVLMIDLDNFKTVNDRHGHALGDELLRQLARRLEANARQGDLLARWGGEEFVVLTPDTDLAGAHTVAENLRNAARRVSVPADGERVSVTLSIGNASITEHTASLNALIDEADQQLYRAKEQGRDRTSSRSL